MAVEVATEVPVEGAVMEMLKWIRKGKKRTKIA